MLSRLLLKFMFNCLIYQKYMNFLTNRKVKRILMVLGIYKNQDSHTERYLEIRIQINLASLVSLVIKMIGRMILELSKSLYSSCICGLFSN